jgi:hypothetical protein
MNFECVICHKNTTNRVMSQVERVWYCHGVKMIGYGLLEFVCISCKQEGWYSTAGFEKSAEHINRITGEKRTPLK